MDKRAIGIFDSGIGGLTALKAVNEIMPSEDVIYFGDTKNVPYGEKSREEVIECAYRSIDFLKKKGVKIILAACGTVSSQLEYIKKSYKPNGQIFIQSKKDMKSEHGESPDFADSLMMGIYAINYYSYLIDEREETIILDSNFDPYS